MAASREDVLKRMTTDQMVEHIIHLENQLLNPPAGWYVFGTHLDWAGALEFWGSDPDRFPVWERPASVETYLTTTH